MMIKSVMLVFLTQFCELFVLKPSLWLVPHVPMCSVYSIHEYSVSRRGRGVCGVIGGEGAFR